VGSGRPQDGGWGGEAMNLVADGDPAATVRVAVIDSGLATTHDDLGPEGGFDFGGGDSPGTSWGTDGSGHGTHVSGTVAALNNGFGVRGMAPGVELFGFRVFPEATMSKLIGAVDRCIEHQIDVVNMSLGSSSKSVLLQQRLRAARDAGVLPVAAAGNSAGPVLFPAAFPEALCVAAIGRLGTFPDNSPHAGHVTDRLSADGRYFAAKFTCRGPEVNVCAPGVAIISSVPPNGYAAFDGTSMASPHVAGFAARLLQTLPEIREMARGPARSQALFDAVVARCEPLGLPAEFQGAGLPRLPAEADHGGSEDGGGQDAGAPPSLEQIRDLIEQALAKARALP
jgi:subtilisin family serine protease